MAEESKWDVNLQCSKMMVRSHALGPLHILQTLCRAIGKLLCPGCLDSGSKLETSNQNNKEAKEIIRESVF